MNRTILFVLLVAAGFAQQPVAPSPDTVGRSRGEDRGEYNVVHSFETGYRFHSVGGNHTRYRSDVNFGNGIRLLGSNLLVNSKEGHGRLFDEIVLNTQGLGNDPYESANLRVQHNKFYRYDLLWRLADYENPGLAGTAGGHYLSTRRKWQDHDLTLLPGSRFQLFLGYSRNAQEGTGLSSIQLFDARGDEFPLLAQVNRRQREYRLGTEIRLLGLRLNVHRGWERYEERVPLSLPSPSEGAFADDFTTLQSFRRTEPYQGSTPYWRGSLFTERKDWISVNGRFSYAGGRRDFTFDEASAGTNRLGNNVTRQVVVTGRGSRPVSSGALTLAVFPNQRVTLTNHTAFHQVKMNGDAVYAEINNSGQPLNYLRFQGLDIRSIVNTSDANVRLSKWFGVFAGYHYSTRRVRSTEGQLFPDATGATTIYSQNNRVQSGLAGIRLQASKAFSVLFDAEIGRASRPFLPVSERNYHGLSARAQYRTKTLTASVAARALYNTNPLTFFTHSARSRNYTADLTWTPNTKLALDGGYARVHLDTLTGIAYFAGSLVGRDRSLYISNIHSVNGGIRVAVSERVNLWAGYSRVQDTGDGRATAITVDESAAAASSLNMFRGAQTFPLAYQSPQGRLSVKLHEKLRWNAGYQGYHYREEFPGFCRMAPAVGLAPAAPTGERAACPVSGNYRAHTGYTSVIWSF